MVYPLPGPLPQEQERALIHSVYGAETKKYEVHLVLFGHTENQKVRESTSFVLFGTLPNPHDPSNLKRVCGTALWRRTKLNLKMWPEPI